MDPFNPQRRVGVTGQAPAGGQVGVTNPGFRDERPAQQVLANPVQGYDYSQHPQGQQIQQGMRQRSAQQIGSGFGHPILGMLAAASVGTTPPRQPGVQAPAEQEKPATPSANVGLPNAYAPQPRNLPEPGKSYPADQHFDIPQGWGQGYIESNGQRMYAYNTPQQAQASQDRAWDAQRHAMMTDLHGSMKALMRGQNGMYGNQSPEERLAAMGNIAPLMANMIGADQAGHAAELQFGNDPRHNPEFMSAQIGNLNAQAAAHFAEAANADPMKKLDVLKAINADPHLRATFLASQGVDGPTIASMPAAVPQGAASEFAARPGVQGGNPLPGGVAVNAGNFDAWLAQDKNRAAASVLGDPDANFARKLQLMSQMPGFNDPNHPTRQAWDTYAHRTFPSQGDYQKYVEGLPAFGPDQWQTPVPLGPLKEWIGGPMLAGIGSLTGQGGGGYGFGWRARNKEREDLFDALDKTGWTY